MHLLWMSLDLLCDRGIRGIPTLLIHKDAIHGKWSHHWSIMCSTTVPKTANNIFCLSLSRQFLLLAQVHNCLLIWSLYALKCMVVCALSKNTVVFSLSIQHLFVEFGSHVLVLHSLVLNHPAHCGLGGGYFCPLQTFTALNALFFTLHSLYFLVLVPKHSYKTCCSCCALCRGCSHQWKESPSL